MSSLLGLLLLFCGGNCALPLPGHVLEVSASGEDWQWCLRDDDDGLRVCAEEFVPRLHDWIDDLGVELPAQ